MADPKFYIKNRNLEADFDGQRETLIVSRFMQNENADKCADYLRRMVPALTATFAADFEAGQDLLEGVMDKVDEQQGNEKFFKAVEF